MAILDALQSASVKLVKRRPRAFFDSSATFEIELADLASEVARDIQRSHDWRALGEVHVIVGDGEQTVFPLPRDYDRMHLDSEFQDPQNWAWGYRHILDINEWLYESRSGTFWRDPGAWIIYGGNLNFVPAPAHGEQAFFPYISNRIGTGTEGQPITLFSADTDQFFEEDRLLMLGLVWRWRAQQRLDFATDYESYDKALQERAAKDKGATIIRSWRQRRLSHLRPAHPWPLGRRVT